MQAIPTAKADIRKVLDVLNKHLQTRTFLVGERLTIADIVVSLSLIRLYERVLDNGFRKQFQNTNRWYTTCVNQPQFKNVIGEPTFCVKMEVAKGMLCFKVNSVTHFWQPNLLLLKKKRKRKRNQKKRRKRKKRKKKRNPRRR
jgi:elongation factor 1-gamma